MVSKLRARPTIGDVRSAGGEDGKFGGSVYIGEIDCTGETVELFSTRELLKFSCIEGGNRDSSETKGEDCDLVAPLATGNAREGTP
jgi:hypothetical protein